MKQLIQRAKQSIVPFCMLTVFYQTVIVLPKLLPFTFGDEPSFLGESTIVQCSVSAGDMPVQFTWFRNGQPLVDDGNHKIGSFGKKTSVLSIDSLSEEHAGHYTCVAHNRAGMSSVQAELSVKGI